jgi:phosphatidate cytidylyltransferase
VLLLLIVIGGQWEFYQLLEKMGIKPGKFQGVLFGLVIFTLSFLHAGSIISAQWFWLIAVAAGLLPLEFVVRKSKLPLKNLLYTLLGVVYIAVPLSLANYLVFTDIMGGTYHYHILLYVLILIWTNDTFAYLTGKFLGKHKMAVKISPKKTWEGAIGGLLFSIGASLLIYQLSRSFTAPDWIVLAVIISITSNIGDLTESAIKRTAGVKDSGNILPGHGGILDRFDATIFSIPFVYVYLLLTFF